MLCYYCMREKGNHYTCPFCHNASVPNSLPHQLPPGKMIGGRYILGRVLGEGGFGITYLGFDTVLEIPVAIKEYFVHGYVHRATQDSTVFPIQTGNNVAEYEKGKEHFLREAKNLARFRSEPCIVEVTDFLEENNTVYIVMEYLDGTDLRHYLKTYGTIAPEIAFSMLMPMMRSLDKIHQTGLIHRDISPDNIMVMKDGKLKLMDFGSARDFISDNKSLSVMLKHGYAPEEQYRRRGEQGPWTDVYSLCATIYRCITGKVPPYGSDRLYQDTLVKPSAKGVAISPYLENVLMYGLAVRKEDRCPDMATLLRLTNEAMAMGQSVPPVPVYDPPADQRQGDPAKPQPEPVIVQEEKQPADEPKPVNEQTVPQKQEPAPLQPDNTEPAKAPSKKHKRVIIIAAALAAVIGIALTCFFIFRNKTEYQHYDDGKVKIKTVYNASGNILSETGYYPDGEEGYRIEYEYGSNGKKSRETGYRSNQNYRYVNEYDSSENLIVETKYQPDGDLEDRWEYEYDSSGNQIKAIKSKEDEPMEYRVMEYEKGQKVKTTEYDPNGNVHHWLKHENDSEGRPIKDSCYGPDDQLLFINKITYDKDGNVIKEIHYKSDSELEYSIENTYDPDGNLTEMKRYDASDKYMYGEKNEYDSLGLLKSKNEYGASDVKRKETTYQSDGNMIKEVLYEDSGEVVEYVEYKIDPSGNRIEKKSFDSSDQPKSVSTYDVDGNETERTLYESGKQTERRTYKRDSDGKVVEEKLYDADDVLTDSWDFKPGKKAYKNTRYDADGNKTGWFMMEYNNDLKSKDTWYNAKGLKEYSWTYEYNNNDLCTKSSLYDENDELEYYIVHEYNDKKEKVKDVKYDPKNHILETTEY